MTERPSAAELWPVLPVAVREKLLAYGHKYWQQVYEDVALQNQNWIPLRSPVVDACRVRRDESDHAAGVAARTGRVPASGPYRGRVAQDPRSTG